MLIGTSIASVADEQEEKKFVQRLVLYGTGIMVPII